MAEQRRTGRESRKGTIEASVTAVEFGKAVRSRLTAELLDESDEGFSIMTDYPLEPGQVLCFSEEIRRHWIGVVVYVKRTGSANRAGITFKW